MTAISIFRKLYRVQIYSSLIAAVLLGLAYIILVPEPFEPVVLDGIIRLVAAILLVFGSFGLAIELMLTLTQGFGKKQMDAGYRLFFLPTYEPLDRTRKPKALADTVRENRATEVRIVKDFTKGNGRLMQLTGSAGLGKSSLAAMIARRTDFWVNLTGRRVSSSELVRLLAEWLGEDTIASKAAADGVGASDIEQIRVRIAEKPVRLFFNGFDAFLNTDGHVTNSGIAPLFETLLRSEGNHKIVLMSKRQLHAEMTQDLNAAFLPLEELSESESTALLYADEVFDNSLDAEEIAFRAGGNPMLLNMLPPILQRTQFEEINDVRSWFMRTDMPALSQRFLKLAAGEDFALLQKLSLVPEPMTQSFISALAEAAGADDAAVGRLQERRLIEWDAGLKKFSLHAAVSTGTYHALAADAAALNEARRLVARVCIAKADDFKPEDKWTSISDCRMLLRAVDLLKSCGEVSQAADLGERLRPHLQGWGEAKLISALLTEADPLAGPLDNPAQQTAAANVLRRRAATLHDEGKDGGAIDEYLGLLMLANKHKRQNDILFASGRLAELYAAVGNIKQADKYGLKQFQLAKATSQPAVIAAAAGRVGHVLTAAGDHATAERYYSAAAEGFREIDSLAGEAKALGYLARTSFALGNREDASEAVGRRADLLTMLGKTKDALKARMELAALYRRTGDTDSANAIYEDIVRRAKKEEHLSVASDVLHELAKAAFASADYARALLLQQERLGLAEKTGDDHSAGAALGMIAHCHVRTKDIPAALKHYAAAREKFVAEGYRRGIARCGHYSARLLASQKLWDEAQSAVLDSLDYALQSGERGTLGIDLKVLGLCHQTLGDATFKQMGVEQLGEERFAAVLDLMR